MANIPSLPFTGTQLHTALVALNDEAGTAGASAYDVAVANGFVGTEAEWLASLQGADGADGSQGPVGPAGADGQDGAQGPAGADGADGTQGPAGADGADAVIATFATNAEAEAFSIANPGAAVFSTEVI
jgi:hypothetical protein